MQLNSRHREAHTASPAAVFQWRCPPARPACRAPGLRQATLHCGPLPALPVAMECTWLLPQLQWLWLPGTRRVQHAPPNPSSADEQPHLQSALCVCHSALQLIGTALRALKCCMGILQEGKLSKVSAEGTSQ